MPSFTGQVFWSLLWCFCFVIWLWPRIVVFPDVFRSHLLSGTTSPADEINRLAELTVHGPAVIDVGCLASLDKYESDRARRVTR
jgi:hypothetical protein